MIAKAKVPIIKFEEASSSFNFDISFDVANGPVAAAFVSQLMLQLPAMRPLVLVLKIFLQQREFNEVQATFTCACVHVCVRVWVRACTCVYVRPCLCVIM